MSDFETQAAIDVPQQEAKQEKVKKAYRYPEKLRPFVHPKLSFAAIACVFSFAWALMSKITLAADFWGFYLLPFGGIAVNAIYSFVALFVGKKLHGKFNIIDWLAPAILTVAFTFDLVPAIGVIGLPSLPPELSAQTTFCATLEGFMIFSVYPVAEDFVYSGDIIISHVYQPALLVSFVLLTIFTIIPSLVASKHQPGSDGENKTMFRLSVVWGVIFAVMMLALIIFVMVATLR